MIFKCFNSFQFTTSKGLIKSFTLLLSIDEFNSHQH